MTPHGLADQTWSARDDVASAHGWGNAARRFRAEGAVYAAGILLPLLVLALVAALGGHASRLVAELPHGGILEWIYPRSAIREVVAYGGVAAWLLRELRRRTPDEFGRALWRAPVIVAVANFLLPVPFALVHGIVRELFDEQAGWMALQFVVRLLIGYGYVALVEWIQAVLRQDDGSGA